MPRGRPSDQASVQLRSGFSEHCDTWWTRFVSQNRFRLRFLQNCVNRSWGLRGVATHEATLVFAIAPEYGMYNSQVYHGRVVSDDYPLVFSSYFHCTP